MRLPMPAARRRLGLLPAAAWLSALRGAPRCSARHLGVLPAVAWPGPLCAAPRCAAQRLALLRAAAWLGALYATLRCSAQRPALLLAAAWLGALCSAPPSLPAEVAVTVTSRPLTADPRPCTGRFDAQPLPHYTRGPDEFIGFFESNGAGVALADLDGDGRIDIVLAGLHNPTSLVWNEGDLFFRRADLAVPLTRAVNAVDVDGDGLLDLVFTHSGGLPSWWRAEADAAGGRPRFVRMEDERFQAWFPAYAIAWADLDADGDLDLVGASYDAELGALRDGLVVGGGVFFYRNDGTGLLEFERLGRNTHALAIHLGDLDGDGRRDILIGNDFSPPDMVYLNTPQGWTEAQPFTRTPVNTMSFAEGDLDNDGRNELLATDMKPYRRDESTDAAWGPLWAETAHLQPNDGVQVTANVLHAHPAADGAEPFVDTAETAGVDATGWSWSAQFGDLDNDGYLDLYVVNGMIAAEIFSHLPGDELVEENQALRNTGDGRFVPAPEWGLNATQSGRGMSFGDLDNDGDLDVVVNNLAAPSLLFENRLCGGGALEVELRQEGVANNRAVGAVLRLHTAAGTLLREMRASSGYLSSDPARVHFGLGAAVAGDLDHLEVVWPDGAVSLVAVPEPGVLLRVTRPVAGSG